MGKWRNGRRRGKTTKTTTRRRRKRKKRRRRRKERKRKEGLRRSQEEEEEANCLGLSVVKAAEFHFLERFLCDRQQFITVRLRYPPM